MAVFRQPPQFSRSHASSILIEEGFCQVVVQPARKRRMIFETAGQANIPGYLGKKQQARQRQQAGQKEPQSAPNRRDPKFREQKIRKKKKEKRRELVHDGARIKYKLTGVMVYF
jgi:hypothetical protein